MLTACGDFTGGAILPLVITPGNIELSSREPTENLVVRNRSSEVEPLEWTLQGSSSRISLEPQAGILAPGEEVSVALTYDYKGLSRGQLLKETLTLQTGGRENPIPIVFEMAVGGLDACGTARRALESSVRERRTPPTVPQREGDFVPGELLVKYRTQALSTASLPERMLELTRVSRSVSERYDLEEVRSPEPERATLMRTEGDVLETAARLEKDPQVLYAEPNYYLKLSSTPSDPLLSEQWNMLDFGVSAAWEVRARSSVTLAVIDSGVDARHEDLSAKTLPGCDFHYGDNDANPGLDTGIAQAGHGTHVAGIAAAIGNNRRGVVGVAHMSNIKILPVKVFDDTGITGTVDDLIDAIRWSAGINVPGVAPNNFPADIINMSLGIDTDNVDTVRAVDEATKQAYDRGVILVAASGNGSATDRITVPAKSPWVFAVGSVDADRRRSSFSNYAQDGRTVDFVAPGGAKASVDGDCYGVISAFPGEGGGDYICQEGTSMASPFVAGVIALMLAQTPNLPPDTVRKRLRSTSFFDRTFMTRQAYGSGVICADRALGARTRCGQ